MKHTNECPKCHSKSILRIPGKHVGNGGGNIIFIGLTALSAVKVTRYMCEKCGFSEEWIDDKQDIEKLKHRYK